MHPVSDDAAGSIGRRDAQRRALAEAVEAGPIPASHGVVRWRLVDLAQWIWDEFGLSITKQTLSREMRSLGFRAGDFVVRLSDRNIWPDFLEKSGVASGTMCLATPERVSALGAGLATDEATGLEPAATKVGLAAGLPPS